MITLVTGTTKMTNIKTSLPKLFNKELPWNYAVYSRGRALKVEKVNEIQISNVAKRDVERMLKTRVPKKILESYIKEKREYDPEYFIRNCYRNSINGNEGYDLMITDFQFREELKYLEKMGKNVSTIRVFNGEKKRFSLLNDILTDFLLLPLNNHKLIFPKTLNLFPQYRDYTLNKHF